MRYNEQKKLIVRLAFLLIGSMFIVLSGLSYEHSPQKPAAVPAHPQFVMAQPGPIEVNQSDGTTITIFLNGDERGHYAQTTDGYTILQDKCGIYYYAETDRWGNMLMSTVKANNPENRNEMEIGFLESIPKEIRQSEFQQMTARSQQQNETGNEDPWLSESKFAKISGTFPSTGTRKFLVILVNFTDKTFVKTANDLDTLFNVGSGSFKAFYQDNSFNLLTVDSTIVGPYTLSGNMALYGANDSYGDDVNPRLMVREAVDLANADGVDFSQYDNDGNGYVDGIMVVHAGYGEEAGASANCIWSHRWALGGTYYRYYDGVYINDYSTVPELYGNSGSTLTGVGVVVHEFGHNLGCPDTYDTDYTGSGGQSFHLQKWDVMASGSWNNNGKNPAMHNPYAKWKLGWQTPVDLTGITSITLPNAEQNNISYKYGTPTAGEFFMVENRQQTGTWDTYLPGHGLLIYHIDENYINSMYANTFNCTPSHQGIDLEEADNLWSSANYAGDPFPGTAGITSFTDTSTPNSLAWNNADTAKPITNIAENSGVITFQFSDGSGINYCSSGSGNSSNEWIANIKIENLDKTSGASSYSDYTANTINLTKGATYILSLTPGYAVGYSAAECWRIWIDYNKDGDFTDTGEQVYSKSKSGIASGSMVISASVSTGTTRMRVAMSPGSFPSSCGTFTAGEVEDYTVNISDLSYCALSSGNCTSEWIAGVRIDTMNKTSGAATYSDFTSTTVNLTKGATYTVTLTPGFTNGYSAVEYWKIWIDYNKDGDFTDLGEQISYKYKSSAVSGSFIASPSAAIGTTRMRVAMSRGSMPPFCGTFSYGEVEEYTVNIVNLSYCASASTNCTNEWIAGVTVGSLDKTSGASIYSNFTSTTTTLTRGSSVGVTLTPGFTDGYSAAEYWKVWIDYNKDGDFTDGGEQVAALSGSTTVTTSFTVPTSVSLGSTRMRVSMKKGSAPSSCGTFNYGEVEDYTVTVQ